MNNIIFYAITIMNTQIDNTQINAQNIRNRLAKRLEFYNIPFDTFSSMLKNTNAILSGSTILNAIKPFYEDTRLDNILIDHYMDLDIYASEESVPQIIDYFKSTYNLDSTKNNRFNILYEYFHLAENNEIFDGRNIKLGSDSQPFGAGYIENWKSINYDDSLTYKEELQKRFKGITVLEARIEKPKDDHTKYCPYSSARGDLRISTKNSKFYDVNKCIYDDCNQQVEYKLTIEIIIMQDLKPVTDAIKFYDFSMLLNWYDGNNVFIGHKNAIIYPESTLINSNKYISHLRINKYQERGYPILKPFNIKDLSIFVDSPEVFDLYEDLKPSLSNSKTPATTFNCNIM